MAREPAAAGRYYPGGADRLRAMIEQCTPPVEGRQKALGALMPHAGYEFSGRTAGEVVARIEIPGTVLIVNPGHDYFPTPCALWTGGAWSTPLGEVELHEGICDALAGLPTVTPDDGPHRYEHSGEAVLPFLQYQRPDVRIAVICITPAATVRHIQGLGEGLAEALTACGEPDALVVASSDLSHESGRNALKVVNENDRLAMAEMERLDSEGLGRTCRSNRITMCGVLPAAAMMASVRARGGSQGILVHRATSADSPLGGGDYVVGYAGMIFR